MSPTEEDAEFRTLLAKRGVPIEMSLFQCPVTFPVGQYREQLLEIYHTRYSQLLRRLHVGYKEGDLSSIISRKGVSRHFSKGVNDVTGSWDVSLTVALLGDPTLAQVIHEKGLNSAMFSAQTKFREEHPLVEIFTIDLKRAFFALLHDKEDPQTNRFVSDWLQREFPVLRRHISKTMEKKIRKHNTEFILGAAKIVEREFPGTVVGLLPDGILLWEPDVNSCQHATLFAEQLMKDLFRQSTLLR